MSEGRAQRRLSAILAADVLEYSRLVRQDEEAALSAVKSDIDDIFAPGIESHNGRLFKSMGDGFLAEFPSVVDAVRCAVSAQQAMLTRNQDRAANRRIEFRIGINLGDMVSDGDDLQGDGSIWPPGSRRSPSRVGSGSPPAHTSKSGTNWT